MAFLCKEKKFKKIKIDSNNDVGPGLYINPNRSFVRKPNFAPFGSNSKKMESSVNDNPGPASYFQTDIDVSSLSRTSRYFTENFGSERLSRTSACRSTTEESKYQSGKKDDFKKSFYFGSEQRFKVNKSLVNLPGPGCYFKDLMEVKKKKKAKKKKILPREFHIVDYQFKNYLSGPSYSVSTIPPKKTSFGYEISKDTVIRPIDNPDMYKTFSGTKNDSVGPGNYQLDFPESWQRTGTEWSKFQTSRYTPKVNKRKEIKQKIVDSLKCDEPGKKLSQEEIESIKKNNALMKYNIKEKPGNASPKILGMVDYEVKIHSLDPGPGYYLEEKPWLKTFRTSNNQEYDPDREDEVDQKKDSKNQISPATYFKDNYKAKLQMKNKFDFPIKTIWNEKFHNQKEKPPFNAQSQRFEEIKTYPYLSDEMFKNPFFTKEESDYVKKSFNKKYDGFGSKGERSNPKLFDPTKLGCFERYPGPGTYINPFTATGYSNSTKFRGNLMSLERAKKLSHKNSNKTYNACPEEPVQNFGVYDPDVIKSIEFSVFSKAVKSKNIPFGSLSEKDVVLIKKGKVGPGSYIKDKKVKITQIHPPFKSSEQRNLSVGNKDAIAPGSYDLSLATPWRKKEFNVLYL